MNIILSSIALVLVAATTVSGQPSPPKIQDVALSASPDARKALSSSKTLSVSVRQLDSERANVTRPQ
jgi:hypothetical protein